MYLGLASFGICCQYKPVLETKQQVFVGVFLLVKQHLKKNPHVAGAILKVFYEVLSTEKNMFKLCMFCGFSRLRFS